MRAVENRVVSSLGSGEERSEVTEGSKTSRPGKRDGEQHIMSRR
jgi:hypothetical protein